MARPVQPGGAFKWPDWTVVGIYFLLLAGISFLVSNKMKNTTSDFFLGGGKIPWWAAGLSIFGSKLSALTFIAIPAKAYATDPDSPYVYYYRSLFTKLKKNGRIELFKTRRDQPDEEVTLEAICDKLIIWGTPESVADQLLAFQDEVGKFGTLLYAGKDWRDRELARQSMIMMAEKVMPRVNAGTSDQSNAAE